MGSIGNMFSRRAAASESSHARDEAKLSLRRMNEKKQAALDAQQEKIDDLQKALAGTKNSAVKDAISKKIEQEQTALNDMRAQQEKIAARVAAAAANATTVDVLAEISAHSLPLGKPDAHHADPDVLQIHVPPPDMNAPLPTLKSQSQVVSEIYRESPMTYAGGGGWASVRKYLAPSNMLATQQQHMEAKLRRPMSEKEVMAMRSKAKAQVL